MKIDKKYRIRFRVIRSLGEELCFDALYRGHWRSCYLQAFNIFSMFHPQIQIAEDATQEMFLRIFEKSYKCDILLTINNTLDYEKEEDPTLHFVAKCSSESVADFFKYLTAQKRNTNVEARFSDFINSEGDVDESLFRVDSGFKSEVSSDWLFNQYLESDNNRASEGLVKIIGYMFDFSTSRSANSVELILSVLRLGLDKKSILESIGDIDTINGLNKRISSFSEDLMSSDIEIELEPEDDITIGYRKLSDLINGVAGTGKRKELTDVGKFTKFINAIEIVSYAVIMREESDNLKKHQKWSLEDFKMKRGYSPMFLLAQRSDRNIF